MIKQITIFLLMTIFFTGCVQNNTDIESDYEVVDDTVTSELNATVILTTNETTVTLNKDRLEIDVTVIDKQNNPYEGGNVKIIYPDDVREGRDIGYFTNSSVTVSNGHAKFTYTAPNDISKNTKDIIFYFYHENNTNDIKKYTIKLVPEENQIILTSYQIYIDDDDEPSMGLDTSKLISFMIKNEKNENVNDSNIVSIKVTNLNPNLGRLENTQGDSNSSLTISAKNSIPINVKSNTLSGIIPLEVNATFIDANGVKRNLQKIFNLLVLSGPPTAMSLSYSSISQDKINAKFIEKWVLTVTDKYNNLVNTNPSVSMGMIAGYAKSGPDNPSNHLYFENGGEIKSKNNIFYSKEEVFKYVDQVNDVLVTFGDGYTYEASGKWDISTDDNKSILNLVDQYNGKDTLSLGFAVGHNYRQDIDKKGVEWIGNIYPEDHNYIIDNNGHLVFNIEYDYYFIGKDIMLWINLIGMQNDNIVRIGEAKKITLKGNGISAYIPNITVIGGIKQAYTFTVKINDIDETYMYGNFKAKFSTTGCAALDGNPIYTDMTNREANVTVFVTTPSPCTYEGVSQVNISDLEITSEF